MKAGPKSIPDLSQQGSLMPLLFLLVLFDYTLSAV